MTGGRRRKNAACPSKKAEVAALSAFRIQEKREAINVKADVPNVIYVLKVRYK